MARPITAVAIGSPIATTEPNAISRMIIAASRPISSDVPVSGCVPHEAYSPPISASRSGERTSVERCLERLERLDAQVDGRLVVGDLRVADRAVGGQGARGLERIRDRDHVRLARDRVQRRGHGVGLILERPVGRVEDDVGRGAGGGGVALSQQVVGALRLGVRQVEVVGELAAERAADHEDRDHGGDPDAEGAPTVARRRLTEPIEERAQRINLSSGGWDADSVREMRRLGHRGRACPLRCASMRKPAR